MDAGLPVLELEHLVHVKFRRLEIDGPILPLLLNVIFFVHLPIINVVVLNFLAITYFLLLMLWLGHGVNLVSRRCHDCRSSVSLFVWSVDPFLNSCLLELDVILLRRRVFLLKTMLACGFVVSCVEVVLNLWFTVYGWLLVVVDLLIGGRRNGQLLFNLFCVVWGLHNVSLRWQTSLFFWSGSCLLVFNTLLEVGLRASGRLQSSAQGKALLLSGNRSRDAVWTQWSRPLAVHHQVAWGVGHGLDDTYPLDL